MVAPKILILSGSTREGSYNTLLTSAAAREVESRGAVATIVNLENFPMNFVDAGNSGGPMPEPVDRLHALFAASDGIVIATPEYNSFPSPLLLNALDWISRVRHNEGGMEEAFGRPTFAIVAASPSPLGGYRALMALRQKLEIGLGAMVVPTMAWIAAAYQAFGEDGGLNSHTDQANLGKVIEQLLRRL